MTTPEAIAGLVAALEHMESTFGSPHARAALAAWRDRVPLADDDALWNREDGYDPEAWSVIHQLDALLDGKEPK